MQAKRPFNDLQYTRDSLIKELLLIQGHSSDGSALDAGCHCIESKHTFKIEGLAEEGVALADSPKEKQFYVEVAALMRSLRRGIENEWFSMSDVLSDAGLSSGHRVKVECVGPDCPH